MAYTDFVMNGDRLQVVKNGNVTTYVVTNTVRDECVKIGTGKKYKIVRLNDGRKMINRAIVTSRV